MLFKFLFYPTNESQSILNDILYFLYKLTSCMYLKFFFSFWFFNSTVYLKKQNKTKQKQKQKQKSNCFDKNIWVNSTNIS